LNDFEHEEGAGRRPAPAPRSEVVDDAGLEPATPGM
jgi:hypothetical protein